MLAKLVVNAELPVIHPQRSLYRFQSCTPFDGPGLLHRALSQLLGAAASCGNGVTPGCIGLDLRPRRAKIERSRHD
jgi:hypothetical protein